MLWESGEENSESLGADFIKVLISSDGMGPWRSQLCDSVANPAHHHCSSPTLPSRSARGKLRCWPAQSVLPPPQAPTFVHAQAPGSPERAGASSLRLVPMSEPDRCITPHPNHDRLAEDTTAGAYTTREGSTPEQGVLPFPRAAG